MQGSKNIFYSNKGSALVNVLLGAAIIIFVIFPVFSSVAEKYILLSKAQIIKDAVDITNISTYNAIDAENLGRNWAYYDQDEVMEIYRALLAENLRLNPDLTPMSDSIAEGTVIIDSVVSYNEDFPVECPNGIEIKRPALHSVIIVPVKPALYRQLILNALGKEHVDLVIHVDSDIPVNN